MPSRQNNRVVWFAFIFLLLAGTAIGWAAIPQNTLRQNAGGVMPSWNATHYGYWIGTNQVISNTRAFTGITLNTGQGDNELYAMNQDVENTDAVTFLTVNTGHGNNELYAMNQDLETTDDVTFDNITATDLITLGGVARNTWPSGGGTNDNETFSAYLWIDAGTYYANILGVGVISESTPTTNLVKWALGNVTGVVHLSQGVYYCRDQITTLGDNDYLVGEGMNNTVLVAPTDIPDRNGLIENVNHDLGHNENITIRDLMIDGNYLGGNGDVANRHPNGIELAGVNNVLIERVYVKNCLRNGILVEGNSAAGRQSWNILVKDCHGEGFGNNFVIFSAQATGDTTYARAVNCYGTDADTCYSVYQAQNCGFIDSIADKNNNSWLFGGSTGFEITGTSGQRSVDCYVKGCETRDTVTQGILLQFSYRAVVESNYVNNSNVGVYTDTYSNEGRITDNTITGVMTGIEVNSNHYIVNDNHIYCKNYDYISGQSRGIRVVGNYNLVDGNQIYDGGDDASVHQPRGIQVTGDYNLITSNYISDQYAVMRAGIRVDGDYNTIQANEIYNITYSAFVEGGIHVQGGNYNIFRDNAITDALSHIRIQSGTENQFHGNDLTGTVAVTDDGTNTLFDTKALSLVSATEWQTAAPFGGLVNDATDYVLGSCKIPNDADYVIQLKIYGISLGSDTEQMTIEIEGYGGTDNEVYTTETIAIATLNSTTTNFAVNDRIYWVATASDDADIDDLNGDDWMEIKVLHEAASGPSIATNVLITSIEVEYV